MSVCYAIASGKGGVGKSTVTANLGAALADSQAKVVIVDADIGLRSQDALLALEDRVVYDLIDLADGECVLEQALLQSSRFPSLHLLPAAQFARAKDLDPKDFRKVLRSLEASYDFVLIDCPAGIERGLRNVLNAGVNEVFLVVTADDICMRSAERAAQLIGEKQLGRPRLIVNRLDEQLIRFGEMLPAQTVAETLDLPLLGEVPEDSSVYRSLLRHRLPVEYDSEARNAFLRIASRLRGSSLPFPRYGSGKPSLLKRLKRKDLKEVIPIDDY